MSNSTLRDDQWEKIYLFLKNHPRVYAGGEEDCRLFVDGVLWITRSGAQWRFLPDKYGNWNTIYKRFARWCDHDVWDDMHQHFVNDPDMENILLDSTVVRAHPCAAGAQKKRRPSRTGSRVQPRRIQHQNPHQCRRLGQSIALSFDGRATA